MSWITWMAIQVDASRIEIRVHRKAPVIGGCLDATPLYSEEAIVDVHHACNDALHLCCSRSDDVYSTMNRSTIRHIIPAMIGVPRGVQRQALQGSQARPASGRSVCSSIP